ncbi:hypothetical protein SORBI_3003G091200 [Sorghum bicolor]|nr:hypothetical protein SORBI_3003G091200 [Sorghum bicolor]
MVKSKEKDRPARKSMEELDAFECPICLSLFQGPIFQCKNGHVVCDACRVHIHGTCPSCREPVVGDIRCRGLENAMASLALALPCSFRSHGCTELLMHTERRHHEAFLCQHAPSKCPFQGCPYSGLLLYDHIHDAHSCLDYEVRFGRSAWRGSLHRSRPFKVLLDPVDRRVFLLLNGGDIRSGRSLSVVCLGPRPAANQLLEYKLKVCGAGKPGSLSLSASGSVPCMRSWAGQYPTDEFLFVPDAYWTFFNSINANVHVQSSTVNNALVFVFSATMAVMLALALKTSSR